MTVTRDPSVGSGAMRFVAPQPQAPAVALVSAAATRQLRAEVARGARPMPEYLRLSQRYGVNVVDWTRLDPIPRRRSILNDIRHAAVAWPTACRAGALLSDGEHVGVPIALAARTLKHPPRHVVIGHHVTTTAKRRLLALAAPRIDRLLVHTQAQAALLAADDRIRKIRTYVVPYGVDTTFWAPMPAPQTDLVVSAGREHRDYRTLALACAGESFPVFITDNSAHSPLADRDSPVGWPANITRGPLSWENLRHKYATAAVVVVPLVETEFAAGITAVLEAMAMGKPVVVTGTAGLAGVVADGVNGVVIPPNDVAALRTALRGLLASPERRARLGAAARQTVLTRFSLDTYVDALAHHLGRVREQASADEESV